MELNAYSTKKDHIKMTETLIKLFRHGDARSAQHLLLKRALEAEFVSSKLYTLIDCLGIVVSIFAMQEVPDLISG